MKRLGETETFKETKNRAQLLRAAHLMGIEHPQRRSTHDLSVAVRYRISEIKRALA